MQTSPADTPTFFSLGAPRPQAPLMSEWDEISSWSAFVNTWGFPKRLKLQAGTPLGISGSGSGLLRLLICLQPSFWCPPSVSVTHRSWPEASAGAHTGKQAPRGKRFKAIFSTKLFIWLVISAFQSKTNSSSTTSAKSKSVEKTLLMIHLANEALQL